ncbi:MAG: hypothetical protein ACJAT2_000705 [Bacteriovoracaceae bacterium]|jgi:hypothetical protein
MKSLFLVCLFALSLQAMASDVRLVHGTCKLAVHPTYANDGLNQIVTQAADDYLSKKGYKIITMKAAEEEVDNVMAIKVDMKTTVSEGKGRCKTVMSLRPTLRELDSDMLLATIIDKSGSYKTVSNKCIKAIIKNIKGYPACSTVLDPDAEVTAANEAPEQPEQEEQSEESEETLKEKIRRFFKR